MPRKVPACIAVHHNRKRLLGGPGAEIAYWHPGLQGPLPSATSTFTSRLRDSIFGPNLKGNVCTADPVWQSPAEVQPEAEPYAPRVPHDRAVIAAWVRD